MIPRCVADAYMALTPRGRAIVLVVSIVCATALIWRYGWP
jgi:hypothetical protein